jgi:hypothetical protein
MPQVRWKQDGVSVGDWSWDVPDEAMVGRGNGGNEQSMQANNDFSSAVEVDGDAATEVAEVASDCKGWRVMREGEINTFFCRDLKQLSSG